MRLVKLVTLVKPMTLVWLDILLRLMRLVKLGTW